MTAPSIKGALVASGEVPGAPFSDALPAAVTDAWAKSQEGVLALLHLKEVGDLDSYLVSRDATKATSDEPSSEYTEPRDATNLLSTDASVTSEEPPSPVSKPSHDARDKMTPGRSSSSPSIRVISSCVGTDYCDLADANFQRYTNQHQYGYTMQQNDATNGTRPFHWNKVLALRDHLANPANDFVFWMDADSLFMNMDFELEQLVTPGKDLVFSCEPNCAIYLNNGHLFFRNSEWSRSLVEEWWNTYPAPSPTSWFDQSALYYVLSGKKEECRENVDKTAHCLVEMGTDAKRKATALEQRAMNSYVQDYQPGDFIIHFAGLNWVDVPGKGKTYAKRILMELYDKPEVPFLSKAIQAYGEYMAKM